jgi:hypothetical protein
MAKFFQATLTVLVSIAIAILVAVAVLPAHARGGAGQQAGVPGIRHAVLVEHPENSSGDAAPTCPVLGQSATGTSCPYLSSLAASTGCPALPTPSENTGCPYLSGNDRSDASPRKGDVEKAPKTLKL